MYVLLRSFFATATKHVRHEKLKIKSDIVFLPEKGIGDSKRYIRIPILVL